MLLSLVLPLLPISVTSAQTVRPLAQQSIRAQRPVSAAKSNENLLDVAVSDSSTTYLVFGGPLSLVDVGMAGNYLVKIEANAVFVRAKRKNAPPTPMLIRSGSKYWMGRLVYINRPVLQLYDFQKDGALGFNNSSSAGSVPENQLAMDKEQELKSDVEGTPVDVAAWSWGRSFFLPDSTSTNSPSK